MSDWSSWISIEKAKVKKGRYNCLGIYQIRVVTPYSKPIPVCRLVGVDPLGILYIGRSGFSAGRSVANRIGEFVRQQHSGGITYTGAKEVLNKTPAYSRHNLQVRMKGLSTEKEIRSAESRALQEYFHKYGELPPCNSAKSNAAAKDKLQTTARQRTRAPQPRHTIG